MEQITQLQNTSLIVDYHQKLISFALKVNWVQSYIGIQETRPANCIPAERRQPISIVFVYKNALMERKQIVTFCVRRMRRRASGQSTSAQLCIHTEDEAKSKRRFCVRITSIIFPNQFSRSECSGGGGCQCNNSRPPLHLWARWAALLDQINVCLHHNRGGSQRDRGSERARVHLGMP